MVKAPDAQPEQLGFDGFFLPTAVIDEAGPRSIFPGRSSPRSLLSVYTGDLGLDGGAPQSVYSSTRTA